MNVHEELTIVVDDLSGAEIHELLNEHLTEMHQLSPRESVHALDVERLKDPRITFWTAWQGSTLCGCGALREIDSTHGEVKSMRTPRARRRHGAGRAILQHIIRVAKERGYQRLSLETGSMPAFQPAHALYQQFGFQKCGPFADYVDDPNSVFMTLVLM